MSFYELLYTLGSAAFHIPELYRKTAWVARETVLARTRTHKLSHAAYKSNTIVSHSCLLCLVSRGFVPRKSEFATAHNLTTRPLNNLLSIEGTTLRTLVLSAIGLYPRFCQDDGNTGQ